MSSLYLSGVESLQITRNTPKKCDSCYGSGKIHIATVAQAYECPACHGIGYDEPHEVFSQDPNSMVTVAISDHNKSIKIFLDEQEPTREIV